jgi:copper chaperone NosL
MRNERRRTRSLRHPERSGGSPSRTTPIVRAGLLLALLLPAACSRTTVAPAPLDPRNESCAWCRMSVSDPRFAAQLVGNGVEPLFFDDIGCMANYLRSPKRGSSDLAAYVADHRTRAWVPAAGAVYVRCPAVDTPMGSHLIAHHDSASAALDPDTKKCDAATAAEIFGNALPRGGGQR